MIKGLYTAASGMTSYQNQLDLIANNLANVNTTGFKGEHSALKSFPQMLLRRMYDDYMVLGVRRGAESGLPMAGEGLDGLAAAFPESRLETQFTPDHPYYKDGFMPAEVRQTRLPIARALDLSPAIGWMSSGAIVDEVRTWHGQGDLRETAKPLDMALFGAGFFKVSTPHGVRYTRDGGFTLNANSELVTHNGYQVLSDEDLPMVVNPNQDVSVTLEGYVQQGETEIGRLALVDFEDYRTTIAKDGENLYRKVNPSVPEVAPLNLTVQQGYLEGSNVNVIDGMVRMIAAMRTYEASQKAIQQTDGTLDRLMEVGRPI